MRQQFTFNVSFIVGLWSYLQEEEKNKLNVGSSAVGMEHRANIFHIFSFVKCFSREKEVTPTKNRNVIKIRLAGD